MAEHKFLSGNACAAEAVKLSSVKVVAAYPITPQSSMVESISLMTANGELDAEIIHVESEHSAMSACIGAASVGARTFTASCSQGLALMHECLFIASGLRLPIVMCVTNRALSAPANILCDHSDTMASRDCGWIQFWVQDCQEVLDSTVMAFKIAEAVSMPVMVNMDGFSLSHLSEPVEVPSFAQVRDFLPDLKPAGPLVLPGWPGCHGPAVFADYTEEWAYSRHRRLTESLDTIQEVHSTFYARFGRQYDVVEQYQCNDADVILVGMGTMTSTAKEVIDQERKRGKKVGLLRLRVFRPFPVKAIKDILGQAKFVVVMDRSISYGASGPVFQEVSSALGNLTRKPRVMGAVLGIGGRDVTTKTIKRALDLAAGAQKSSETESSYFWPGAREDVLKNWGEWRQ